MKADFPYKKALEAATGAAAAVGKLLRANLHGAKKINVEVQHDIKLELDVRSQKLIEKTLRRAFPSVALLGEEGVAGDPASEWRWVVDPIDGTVNFAYGIPHACVSIALQRRGPVPKKTELGDGYQTMVGVVHDPFCDETWTAIRGQPARLNKRITRVSTRSRLNEAVISMGFAKYDTGLNLMLPRFKYLVPRVRKIRIMGSAALDLVYVASGRMDAYLESGVRLWDIAAGGLILECAGGEFWHCQLPQGDHYYAIVANNGLLRRLLTARLR